MEMRFEVGDKVIVARKGIGWNMDGKMDKWLGKVMTIGYKGMDFYNMEEDQGENDDRGWCWDDEDLEPAEYAVEVTKLGDKMVAKNLISGEKAEVKCEDDINRSTRLALEKLYGKEIHVGDRVRVVNTRALHPTYPEWVVENVNDKLKVAMYAYGKDIEEGEICKVLAVAPHQIYKSETLVYIEEPTTYGNAECFLIGAYGVQKV